MRLNEHPPPHFHVFHGEYNASVTLGSLMLTKGWLPPRIRRLVFEWPRCVNTNFTSRGAGLTAGKTRVRSLP